MVSFCSAHACYDDFSDEEYEPVNYTLAESAELQAAARVHNATTTVQQPQQYEQQQQQQQFQQQFQPQFQQMQVQQQNYPLQPQTSNYSYTAHKQILPLTNSHNSSADPMQIDNIVSANSAFPPSNNRKLKRSCDFECDSPVADASGSKRVKQIAF